MQPPLGRSAIRALLTEAKANGEDPEALYARAVRTYPPDWESPPPYAEVAPA
jgi:hypothetical protein